MENNDIDALFPAELKLEVQGEQFTFTAFKAKHLRPYLAINRRLQDKATRLGQELAVAQRLLAQYHLDVVDNPATPMPDLGNIPASVVNGPLSADQLPIDLLHERCYEEYVELVQIATGKSTDWVENLDIDELVTLAAIVNELNARRYQSKKATALAETEATAQS